MSDQKQLAADMLSPPEMPPQEVIAAIVAKRDFLIQERAGFVQRRKDVLARLRKVESDLNDCDSTARFFGIEMKP